MNRPAPLLVPVTPPPFVPATVPSYEVAVSAAAAQAKATVLARYEMALRKPRNWDQVRADVLKECRRPSFALDKSAFYKKPIGEGVEGLGIRFVEMALRCMSNVLIEQEVRYEDEAKEVIRITVTDLEANVTWPGDITVRKTVERSKPMDDGSFVSVRTNSYGRAVYTVPATDDDLLNKRAALVSKAVRTIGLRVIPGDIQAEGEATIKDVRMDRARQDPDLERKTIVDAFSELRVSPTMLVDYLGHDIGECSPHELVALRGLFGAIRDGEATWKGVMDNKRQQEEEAGAPPPPATPAADRAPRKPTTAERKSDAAGSPEAEAAVRDLNGGAGEREIQRGQPGFNDGSAREGEESRIDVPRGVNVAGEAERRLILDKALMKKVDIIDLLQRNNVSSHVDPETLAGLSQAEYRLLKTDLS